MSLSPELVHGFAGACLAKRYDNAVSTPKFHLELWDLCCSDNDLVAVAAPRRHGKSTAVSHAYVLASVLFRDRRFVLLVSDTESQAVNFLNDIKQELKDNDDLIDLFQIKGFKKETETDIIVEMQDGHTFRILVRGAEQRVRGLKWNQLRPDLIVCHEKDTEIFTPETGWIKNQDYPNSKLIKAHDAYKIEFEDGTIEVVSGDHRYLTDKGWAFPWMMNSGDNVNENITDDIMNDILKKEKQDLKNITIVQKLKRNIKNGLLTIWMLTRLVSVNGTNKTKKKFANKLNNLLGKILLGKQPTVLREEQRSYKQHLLG